LFTIYCFPAGKVHPTLGVGSEETGETQGGVSGDGPIPGTDFIDAASV